MGFVKTVKHGRTNNLVQPFLKWAGGKRQLLPVIQKYIPATYNSYFEPFVGAGALLFHLQPSQAVVNDINPELINCYEVIKTHLSELIQLLTQHQQNHNPEYFYQIRALDRTNIYHQLTKIERAARLIYLNKTCFNGLYRVNSKGQFNTPLGSYKNPNILDIPVLTSISEYLNCADIFFSTGDFAQVINKAHANDFIYLDPPYDPVSATASFTSYALNSFGRPEQIRLKETIDSARNKGCKIMLSNSGTDFIKDLYAGYTIIPVPATRNINAVGSGRGKIEELLIMNY